MPAEDYRNEIPKVSTLVPVNKLAVEGLRSMVSSGVVLGMLRFERLIFPFVDAIPLFRDRPAFDNRPESLSWGSKRLRCQWGPVVLSGSRGPAPKPSLLDHCG